MARREAILLLLIPMLCFQVAKSDMLMEESSRVESAARAQADTGFLEDINFDDFFEDVGILEGSPSTPEHVHAFPSQRQHQEEFHSFIPANPLNGFEAQSSSNVEVIIHKDPYEDDFFTSASDHFDSFDPYSSSSSKHEEFGPPKNFFSEDFSFDHQEGGGHPGASGYKNSGAQESKVHNDYGGGDDGKREGEKKSTKKCEIVTKKHMTCEVCKDDYGGFSEHCSHSLHRGKDQKYSNSKRNKNGNFNPETSSSHGYGEKKPSSDHRSESVASPKKTTESYDHDFKNEKPSSNHNYGHRNAQEGSQAPKASPHATFKTPSQPKFENYPGPPAFNSYQPRQRPHSNVHHSQAQNSGQYNPPQYHNSHHQIPHTPVASHHQTNRNYHQPAAYQQPVQAYHPQHPNPPPPRYHQQQPNYHPHNQPHFHQTNQQYPNLQPQNSHIQHPYSSHQQTHPNLVTQHFKQPSHAPSNSNPPPNPYLHNAPITYIHAPQPHSPLPPPPPQQQYHVQKEPSAPSGKGAPSGQQSVKKPTLGYNEPQRSVDSPTN